MKVDNRSVIYEKIFNKKHPILVDSGASLGAIGLAYLADIQSKHKKAVLVPYSGPAFELAGGQRSTPEGTVKLPQKIGDFTTDYEFIVFADSNDLLIGRDFINKHKSVLDFGSSEFKWTAAQ